MPEVPSDSAVEPDDRPDEEPDPATPLRVVGLLIAFIAIAVAVASLLAPRGSELEPREALADLFSAIEEDFSAGFEAVEAQRLPGGETLVRLSGGGGPEELLFVRFPRRRAEGVLEDQFISLRFDDGGGGRGGPPGNRGGGDGPKLQDAGTLDWHGYEARYARLRHAASAAEAAPDSAAADVDSSADAASYNSIRVNLTTPQQCLIAYARFAPGVEATPAAVEALLGRFSPLEKL